MGITLSKVQAILADIQATNVVTIHVAPITSIADDLIICTGRSKRHVAAIADSLTVLKTANQPIRAQGLGSCEWVIVDCHDIVVHIMQPEIRDFYQLEKLWQTTPS